MEEPSRSTSACLAVKLCTGMGTRLSSSTSMHACLLRRWGVLKYQSRCICASACALEVPTVGVPLITHLRSAAISRMNSVAGGTVPLCFPPNSWPRPPLGAASDLAQFNAFTMCVEVLEHVAAPAAGVSSPVPTRTRNRDSVGRWCGSAVEHLSKVLTTIRYWLSSPLLRSVSVIRRRGGSLHVQDISSHRVDDAPTACDHILVPVDGVINHASAFGVLVHQVVEIHMS